MAIRNIGKNLDPDCFGSELDQWCGAILFLVSSGMMLWLLVKQLVILFSLGLKNFERKKILNKSFFRFAKF